MEEIIRQVRDVVAAYAKLQANVADLSDVDDLFAAGMSSHASVNVMLALEDAFDVEFAQAMLTKATFRSIAAMAEAVSTLVEEPVPSAR